MRRHASAAAVALLCALLALPGATTPLAAQATARPDSAAPSGWRALRLAKWSGLAASATLALHGFDRNRRADDLYEGIERVCVTEPDRCRLAPAGGYADAALEADYRRVGALDRRARTALIGSQVALAATAVLFILDLRNNRPPDNIPWEPGRLELLPARGGGVRLQVHLQVGAPSPPPAQADVR